MKIKSKLVNTERALDVVYIDVEEENEISGKQINHVHAYCFYKDKLVIVHDKLGHWTLPGGSVESCESFRGATIREVKEESNMRVIYLKLLGYQDITENGKIIRQTRSVCTVEPYGNFESDPDGDIDAIKLVDPKDLKSYVDWGVIGDYLLKRACGEKERF